MKKKRILLVYYKLFKPGGVAKVMSTLANELVADGFEVEILLLMSERPHFYQLDPRIKVHNIDTFSHWAWKVCEVNKKAFRKFRKIDNINAYIYHIGVYRMLNAWMKKNHHRYDTVISCFYKLSSFLSLNKNVAGKTIAWEHVDYNTAGVVFGNLRKNYKNLKTIVCINKPGMDFYPQLNKTVLIPNIIGEPFESNSFVIEKENYISFVGRLDREKNVAELIDIFAKANIPSSWKLQIIGDGPEKKRLETLVVELKLQNRITFRGSRNTSEVNQLLKGSKIFAFTSLKEALPLVLVEAMFCSNALLAYDCNFGPADIINERNGFLIPLNDKKSFIEKLELLTNGTDKLDQLMRSAYKESENWKKEKILEEWKKIL